MDAVKVFEPTDEQIAAVKAQWSKTPTRRTVTKVTKVAKASTPKPTKEGAIWSDKLGGFFPLAWLDSPAVKAADGRPLQQNPLRQFKGQDGCVMTYNGGAWGNGSPIELQYAGEFVTHSIERRPCAAGCAFKLGDVRLHPAYLTTQRFSA